MMNVSRGNGAGEKQIADDGVMRDVELGGQPKSRTHHRGFFLRAHLRAETTRFQVFQPANHSRRITNMNRIVLATAFDSDCVSFSASQRRFELR
jgi:hypothetical protein